MIKLVRLRLIQKALVLNILRNKIDCIKNKARYKARYMARGALNIILMFMCDNNKMKFNKMLKIIVNKLKYTQNIVCLAVGKIVRSPLRLWLASYKTYIGSIKKGFSFLGYKILGETLRVSTTSLQRLRANINRLYEQQASNARLGRYLEKWLRWAKGGVNNLISPININININPNPSTRMQVRVSNDMCHVFW